MRSVLLVASALFAFGATMTLEIHARPAPSCAPTASFARAAPAPNGAVVVRKPVKVCKTTIVNGVKVRRCT